LLEHSSSSRLTLAGTPARARNQLIRLIVASTKASELVPAQQDDTSALDPIGMSCELE
jgi:hypothetical protein